MAKVKIVIPAYRSTLSELDTIALSAVKERLGRYPVAFVVPKGLDTSAMAAIIPDSTFEEFEPDYFRGIMGYNRLMMSADFYRRFDDCEYILIYQLDAYAFSDRLEQWCDRGYDYVGAPWLLRPIYKLAPLKLGSKIKHAFRSLLNMPDERATWWAVGNGGFSLRRVSSHLRATEELRHEVERYLSHRNHMYNEDVFFSLEVNRHGLGWKYPSWKEALEFAFDKYPRLCLDLNDGKLPFGCHAWTKRRMKKFWFPIILEGRRP